MKKVSFTLTFHVNDVDGFIRALRAIEYELIDAETIFLPDGMESSTFEIEMGEFKENVNTN